ncbi:DHA2 family efflux MFS transporter permease subunit [Actinocorallia aurantiaca]|uniref:DHA2 family efflux MFS transporter permease subunit n=2 Tax=Actinocorallia aurantiaca TaxID=46204 RepID=A0ABP6GJX2_9ACTN
MTYLDNNVVNVALPSIQRELDLTISGLEWIVSSYILVFAGLLLAGGRLADIFGVRAAFLGGLGVFTLASAIAGVAGTQEILLGARALQGVGAALLAPAVLAAIAALFPEPAERAKAIGLWGGVGALALALGPLIGGVLSQHAHWGWIFLVNVPFGIVTAILGARHLPAGGGSRRPLDAYGLVASSAALLALTYALIEGERHGWTSALILGSFAAAAVFAAAFLVIERRAADPMIDLRLFRRRTFTGGLTIIGLWSFGVFGIYFFLALYLQGVLGFSPTRAGAAFIPLALVMAVVSGASDRLAKRFGPGPVTASGMALMAASVGWMSTIGAGGGYLDLLPPFLAYGIGAGMLIPLTDVVIGAIPASEAGVAGGVLNVSREVFGLLGVTVLGAILTARQAAETPAAFLDAYRFTLVVAAVIIALAVPLALAALRRPAPAPDKETEPVLAA